LIGLETGVLDQNDARTRLTWDGTHYDIAGWNREHTLASATRESVVWYFQTLAGRIGAERMQLYLDRIGYGNRDISGGLTRFWLRSSLQISAMEQVDVLNRLYAGALPFSAAARAIVLKNITLSNENGIKFMGKTGSGYQDGKWIFGWFVGYIETQGKVYVFATNVEGEDEASGVKAREITRQIAKDLGLL
jgi:bla regulator protein BlaR1